MIIKCKMCGGDMELSADKTFGTCEYCGSTMTLPKIDSDQRAAIFNRGNHFRRIGEFDKALAVYERIVAENDTDAEAHWCCALCRYGIEYVEDPSTYEWLPTCHRASFDSFLEDVDYLAALEHSDGITRRQYQKDAAKIAEIQRGILAASRSAEPYDVFISYKELDAEGNRTRDSILAQDIYYQLTEKGWRVFFSRISLEDVPGTQYEPYIFAALNSAKVMVVVGTSAENLNAVWVKNEWSRFISLMRKDKSKLLLPCYRDMDPYDLPEQLSVLMSYDMGKIGFIQDLIRGVDKVLAAEKPKETEHGPARETVVVQQGGGPNVSALIKRGYMALEDRNWAESSNYFNRVLDMDAECAEAYLGLFLAANMYSDLSEYTERSLAEYDKKLRGIQLIACEADEARIGRIAEENHVPFYLEKAVLSKLCDYSFTYLSYTDSRKKQLEEEKAFLKEDRNFERACKFASGSVAETINAAKTGLFDRLQERIDEAAADDLKEIARIKAEYAAHLDKAEAEAKRLREAAEAKREANYLEAIALAEAAGSAAKFSLAAQRFEDKKLIAYKDSSKKALYCREKASEARRKAEEAEKKRLAAKLAISGILSVFALAAVLICTFVIIPGNKYKAAEALLAAEKYDEAIAEFEALGEYKDSADRALEAGYIKAEELLDAGKYDEAIAEFEALGEYKDSADRALEAGYIKAEELLAAEKYDEAIAEFEALGEYKDSAKRVDEVKTLYYAAAEELFNARSYAQAGIAFARLGDYEDASARSHDALSKAGLWESVSAGYSHTVGLKTDGTVVATKFIESKYSKDKGQCEVRGWTDIVAVSAGRSHTVGLKADGTVVAVGDKDFGQCDVSGWTDIVAVSAGWCHTVGLKSDGTVVAVGDNDDGQCNVSGWTDIVAVSAGRRHTVGLKSDGTVVAVGDNDDGQCNVSGWTDIVAVSAGWCHTVGLKSNGTVVAVGDNDDGQCDVSGWTDIVAASAGSYHTVGLKSDGTVVATEFIALICVEDKGQCKVSGWTDIVAVSAGDYHTVGLKSDGTVVATEYTGNREYYYGQCEVSGWRDIRVPEV